MSRASVLPPSERCPGCGGRLLAKGSIHRRRDCPNIHRPYQPRIATTLERLDYLTAVYAMLAEDRRVSGLGGAVIHPWPATWPSEPDADMSEVTIGDQLIVLFWRTYGLLKNASEPDRREAVNFLETLRGALRFDSNEHTVSSTALIGPMPFTSPETTPPPPRAVTPPLAVRLALLRLAEATGCDEGFPLLDAPEPDDPSLAIDYRLAQFWFSTMLDQLDQSGDWPPAPV